MQDTTLSKAGVKHFFVFILDSLRITFMHPDHDVFVKALEDGRNVEVVFFYDENDMFRVRLCAAAYYGPSSIEGDSLNYYHFWDLEDGTCEEALILPADQIVIISQPEEQFEPAGFLSFEKN